MSDLTDLFSFMDEMESNFGLDFQKWDIPAFMRLYLKQKAESSEKFKQALKTDATATFFEAVREEVRDCRGVGKENANFNCVLIGKQKGGKSTVATAIFLIWKYEHSKVNDFQITFQWTFQSVETLDVFSKVPPFTMILQDEDDALEGEGSITMKNRLGNLIERGRASGVCLIISSPSLARIPGCDYAIMPIGKNKFGQMLAKKGDYSQCETFCILYHKDPLSPDGFTPLGFVILPVGNAIQLMKDSNYFELKMKSFDRLRDQLGASGVPRPVVLKQNRKYIEKLMQYAKERLPSALKITKKDLQGLIWETDIPRTNEEDFIVKMAEFWLRRDALKDKKKQSESLLTNRFEFDLDSAVHRLLLNVPDRTDPQVFFRNVMIYKEMMLHPEITNEGWIDHPMRNEFPAWPQDQSAFSKIRQSIAGYISILLGDDYAESVAEEESVLPHVAKAFSDGRKGEPDVVVLNRDGSVKYISCKCGSWKGRNKSYKYDDFAPELLAAQNDLNQGKVAMTEVRIYNLLEKIEFRHEFPMTEVRGFSRGDDRSLVVKDFS